jgi:hypothetical protein
MNFWHTQPVFHIYNLKYWLKPPGIINKEPPPVNKFVNLSNNKLINLSEEKSILTKQLCNFIQDYYIIHPSAAYKPSESDIMAYLECSNHPAYFNVYQEARLLFEQGSIAGLPDNEIVGVTSARVLNVTFPAKKIKMPVYYIDNLCVKPGYRKKGIPPQMIQTFYYNISRNNPKVNAYMFKREGTLTAIVPLICFNTHHFDITNFQTSYVLNPAMSIIEIGAQQLNMLIGFIKEQMPKFDCVVLPDVSSVLNLIKLEKLIIYCIIMGGEVIAAYVFRPLELYYAGKKTVECIAVISNCLNTDVLTAGFNMSLLKVMTKCKGTGILLIEETAHSEPVIAALTHDSTVLRKYTTPTAFFLYNYACYSVEKTLFIY